MRTRVFVGGFGPEFVTNKHMVQQAHNSNCIFSVPCHIHIGILDPNFYKLDSEYTNNHWQFKFIGKTRNGKLYASYYILHKVYV